MGAVVLIGVFVVVGIVFAIVCRRKGTEEKTGFDGPGSKSGSTTAEFATVGALVEDDARFQPKVKSVAEQLREIDWFQFEKLVALAYSGTGVVARRGGANPDGGIDLVLERNGERIGIQCKHWRSWSVGVKVVREMIGAMADAGLKKGVIVALNDFTAEAKETAARHQIELVDEGGLMGLLKYLDAAEVQGILSDRRKVCPKCEREMTLRTARKGGNQGGQFWGCSGFPECRQTLRFESVG